MAFGKVAAAKVSAGKLVRLVLDMLPGAPVVHLEHLGETNVGYLNDQIARANARAVLTPGKLSRRALREARERSRETLARHAIRHLEATHDDGSAASDKDIPDFCVALPDDVVDFVHDFARNVEHWRERSAELDADEPEKLAEKS